MTIIAIVGGLLLAGIVVYGFRQGMKVTPDGSGNGTNSDNMNLPSGSS